MMVNEEDESLTETILEATTLCVILVLGMILNLTVIIVYGRSKLLKSSRNNVCVMNLIVCDVIFLVFVMPVSLANIVCPEHVCASVIRIGFLCQMTGFLSVFQCTLAAFTLTSIAIDRYLTVVRRSKTRFADRKMACHVTILVIWMWSGLTASPPFLFPDSSQFSYEAGTKHCSPTFKTDCWFFWFALTMGMGFTLPSMIFCYFNIAREVRRQKRKVLVNPLDNTGESLEVKEEYPHTADSRVTNNGGLNVFVVENKLKLTVQMSMSRVERAVAKRGAIMVLAYFLCWSPYAMMHACPVRIHGSVGLEVMSMWLVFTLTIWNPIIYVFNNRQFMGELKRLTSRQR